MSTVESTVSYRPITEFPGYRIGDDGSVWSQWKLVSNGIGFGTRSVIGDTWKKLKHTRWGKYFTVRIGGQTRAVHSLVLEAFVGPRPDGMEGCHGDGNPGNNALSNLRWDTHRENGTDMIRHGRTHLRDTHKRSKLTREQVDTIRERYMRMKQGRNKLPNGAVKSIAEEYGVNICTIFRAIKEDR